MFFWHNRNEDLFRCNLKNAGEKLFRFIITSECKTGLGLLWFTMICFEKPGLIILFL